MNYVLYDNSSSHLVSRSEMSVSPADGLVIGKEDVTVLAPHHVVFTGEQIVGLTCVWQEDM